MKPSLNGYLKYFKTFVEISDAPKGYKQPFNSEEVVEIIERERDYSRSIKSNMRVVMSRNCFYIDHSF